MKLHHLVLLMAILLFAKKVSAQIESPVHWRYAIKKISKTDAVILIKADIEGNWHIYSVNQPDGGPVKTSFHFTPSGVYSLIGDIKEPAYITKFEKTFNIDVHYFETQVVFQQKIKLNKPTGIISGKINYMCCDQEKCLPPDEINFKIPIK